MLKQTQDSSGRLKIENRVVIYITSLFPQLEKKLSKVKNGSIHIFHIREKLFYQIILIEIFTNISILFLLRFKPIHDLKEIQKLGFENRFDGFIITEEIIFVIFFTIFLLHGENSDFKRSKFACFCTFQCASLIVES